MPKKLPLYLIVGSVLLLVGAIAVWQRDSQRRFVTRFQNLHPNAIAAVVFYDRFPKNGEALIEIKDPEVLADFTDACSDMQFHSPGKGGTGESYQKWLVEVRLSDGTHMEIEWIHRGRLPEDVVGRFVKTSPNSLLNYGAFRSTRLRTWFQKHVKLPVLVDRR